MKYIVFVAIVIYLFSFNISAKEESNQLKSFKTDYCTMFVDGTIRNPTLWRDCCFAHDLRYWFGGSKKDQLKADKKLKYCVRKKANSFYANMIYWGVRLGHYSPKKHKYKWSWGWKQKRGFKTLNSQELGHINQSLDQLDLKPEFLKNFKKFYSLESN